MNRNQQSRIRDIDTIPTMIGSKLHSWMSAKLINNESKKQLRLYSYGRLLQQLARRSWWCSGCTLTHCQPNSPCRLQSTRRYMIWQRTNSLFLGVAFNSAASCSTRMLLFCCQWQPADTRMRALAFISAYCFGIRPRNTLTTHLYGSRVPSLLLHRSVKESGYKI